MSNYSVEFEEPPAQADKTLPPIRRRLQPLYDRPGQWARVHSAPNAPAAASWATNLNKGNVAGIDAGEFEARYGEVNGSFYVWARYVK